MHIMRTNIEIADGLIAELMAQGGHSTRKAAVEAGLRLLVRLAWQREAAAARWGSNPDRQAPTEGLTRDLCPREDPAQHKDQAPLR
jgi:Arc/MetJ family transcription regulator